MVRLEGVDSQIGMHDHSARRHGPDPTPGELEPLPIGWEAIVDLALAEDLAAGDPTTLETVAAEVLAQAEIVAKEPGVLSGLGIAAAVFCRVDPAVRFEAHAADGSRLAPGEVVATVAGSAWSLLAAERVALNLLQHLSGIATPTARYVAAVEGTGVRILDTRKTTPGLRALEKAAVRHGGGHNHRSNLGAGVLIKDKHLTAVGGDCPAFSTVRWAREAAPHGLKVEVEVTTLAELEEALVAGADIVLLDNMGLNDLSAAVRGTAGRALPEASGGVTLETVGAVANTGVDVISIGALIHSAPALDLGLDFQLRSREPDQRSSSGS